MPEANKTPYQEKFELLAGLLSPDLCTASDYARLSDLLLKIARLNTLIKVRKNYPLVKALQTLEETDGFFNPYRKARLLLRLNAYDEQIKNHVYQKYYRQPLSKRFEFVDESLLIIILQALVANQAIEDRISALSGIISTLRGSVTLWEHSQDSKLRRLLKYPTIEVVYHTSRFTQALEEYTLFGLVRYTGEVLGQAVDDQLFNQYAMPRFEPEAEEEPNQEKVTFFRMIGAIISVVLYGCLYLDIPTLATTLLIAHAGYLLSKLVFSQVDDNTVSVKSPVYQSLSRHTVQRMLGLLQSFGLSARHQNSLFIKKGLFSNAVALSAIYANQKINQGEVPSENRILLGIYIVLGLQTGAEHYFDHPIFLALCTHKNDTKHCAGAIKESGEIVPYVGLRSKVSY